jgi:hypothetical protein
MLLERIFARPNIFSSGSESGLYRIISSEPFVQNLSSLSVFQPKKEREKKRLIVNTYLGFRV